MEMLDEEGSMMKAGKQDANGRVKILPSCLPAFLPSCLPHFIPNPSFAPSPSNIR
jgi:hypothetical protein